MDVQMTFWAVYDSMTRKATAGMWYLSRACYRERRAARLQRQGEGGGGDPAVVALQRRRVCLARRPGQRQDAVVVQALQQLRYEVHRPAQPPVIRVCRQC